MACLQPPLERRPPGAWLCPACCAEEDSERRARSEREARNRKCAGTARRFSACECSVCCVCCVCVCVYVCVCARARFGSLRSLCVYVCV